ncbi:MAG: DUF4870 domain-containing protein, partial [Candidatus Brocadiia bacterium]
MAEINDTSKFEEKPAAFEQSPEQPMPDEPTADEKNMAMLCHLLGIIGFFAPLVIWLNEKDRSEFVRMHGLSALNYQISIMLYFLACVPLIPILIGIFMIAGLFIMHVVFT